MSDWAPYNPKRLTEWSMFSAACKGTTTPELQDIGFGLQDIGFGLAGAGSVTETFDLGNAGRGKLGVWKLDFLGGFTC